ncbi:uncharacterized protein LOC124119133 isoform X2 [Haliotis rufescens]|uniref:uncharacterized protein LOC124119133 isoform X2 n=1 Tax=Haliotis rufescens TaxID=6454 RepID=UPI00201F5448|nr:uncharacterized protein LOC124119133 isoform X2 [Haliotis rufescens]
MDSSGDTNKEERPEPLTRSTTEGRYNEDDPADEHPHQGVIRPPCPGTGETGAQLQGTQPSTLRRVIQFVLPAVLCGAHSVLTDALPPFIPHVNVTENCISNDQHRRPDESHKVDRTTDTLTGESDAMDRTSDNLTVESDTMDRTTDSLTGESDTMDRTTDTLTGESDTMDRTTDTLTGESDAMDRTTDNLTVESDTMDRTTDSLTGESDTMDRTTDTLTGESDTMDRTTDTLTGESDNLDTTTDNLHGESDTMDRTTENLTGESDTMDRTTDNLTGESDTIDRTTDNLTGESDTIDRTTDNLTGESDNLERISNNLTGESDTIDRITDNLHGESDTMDRTSDNLTGESDNLDRTSDNLTGESDTMDRTSDNLTGESDTMDRTSDNLTGESDTMDRTTDTLTGESDTIDRTTDNLTGESDTMDRTTDNLTGESYNLDTTTGSLTGESDTMDRTSDSLTGESDTMDRTTDNLHCESDTMDRTTDNLTGESDTIGRTEDSLTGESDTMDRTSDSLTGESDTMDRTSDNLHCESDTMDRTTDNLTGESDTIGRTEDNLTGESDTMDRTTDTLTGESDTMDRTTDNLTGESDTMDRTTDNLHGESDTMDRISDNLTGESDNLDRSTDSLTGESDTIDRTTDNLTDESDTMDRTTDNLTGESDTIDRTTDSLTGESDTMDRTTDNLTGESDTMDRISDNLTSESDTMDRISDNLTGESDNLDRSTDSLTCGTDTMDRTTDNLTGESDTMDRISDNLTGESDNLDRSTDSLTGGTDNLNRGMVKLAEIERRDHTVRSANLSSDDQASSRQAVIEIGENSYRDTGSSALKVIQPNQQPRERCLTNTNLPISNTLANSQVPSLHASRKHVPGFQTSPITETKEGASLTTEGLSFIKAPSSSQTTPEKKPRRQPVPSENQEAIGQRFKNICETTQAMIAQHDTVYVSTYGERMALKHLQQRGAIFMKGRPGSGKSRLGLKLLADVSRLTDRKPVVLTSAEQWRDIPQKQNDEESGNPANRYVVMIDDIFGSTNFVESRFDEWTGVFDVMHPSVESGHVMLVLASRPDISHQCQARLNKYKLTRHMFYLTLDEDELTLRPREKMMLLKSICETKVKFTKHEINEIVQLKTTLGFPQCCRYFAGSKEAQAQRVRFFQKPNEYVLEEVRCLQESDGLGYLVLLIVLFGKGYLDTKNLQPHKSPQEFKKMLDDLTKLCSKIPNNRSLYEIKQKADSLCGSYLWHTEKGYVFQHQSIFDAVFINISQVYPDIYIHLCPANIFVEFVRTSERESENRRNLVLLNEDHYEAFADRIIQLMVSEEVVTILKHPSLHNETFVNHVVDRWFSQQNVGDIVSHKFDKSREVIKFASHYLYTQNLEVKTLLELFVLNKHSFMLSTLLEKCRLSTDVLQDCLPCAIYVGSNLLIETLLAQGVKPNGSCFSALCVSRGIDTNTTERLFTNIWDDVEKIQAQWAKDYADHVHMFNWTPFSLAVLNGNYTVVKLLTDKLKHERKNNIIFVDSLKALLWELQTINPYPVFKPYDMDNLTKIMKLLLNNYHANDTGYLCWLASAHSDASALKLILEFIKTVKVALNNSCVTQCIQPDDGGPFDLAAAYGGADCLESLIELNRDPFINPSKESNGSLLHISAKHGNTKCVEMLLKLGHPVMSKDSIGQTPLHLAVSHNQTECVKLLIEQGSSVAMRDNNGQTPLLLIHTSSRTNIDIIKNILKSKKHMKDEERKMLVHKAVACGDMGLLRLLCSRGVDVNMDMEKYHKYFQSVFQISFVILQRSYFGCKETLLHAACRHADVDMVQFLCEIGASVDAVDTDGETVAHAAATSHTGGVEKLQYLFNEKHAPLHKTDNKGRTALFPAVISAAKTGDLELVTFLIDQGLSVNCKDNSNRNLAMQSAAPTGESYKYISETVTHLLNAHLDIHQQDLEGRTALHFATRHTNIDCVLALLQKGIALNIKDNQGMTALHYAAKEVNSRDEKMVLGIMKLLLKQETEQETGIEAQDILGMTPLHHAVMSQKIDRVMLLLQQKVNLNLQETNGKTALHFAATFQSWPIASRLLDGGCDANMRDLGGKTALHYASNNDCIFNILLLLEKDVDIHVQDNKGQTALHIAVEHEREKCVELLLEEGIDPMIQDNDGMTVLHKAVTMLNTSKNNSIVKLLLANGDSQGVQGQNENTNKGNYSRTVDNKGRTALHCAAFHVNNDYVGMLLNRGVDPNIQDQLGMTTLAFATERLPVQSIKLLFDKGADPNLRDSEGRTLWFYARSKDVWQLLMEQGVDPTATDGQGRTTLHYAARLRGADATKLALQKDIDHTLKDDTGRTALHYAADTGSEETVQLLLEKGVDPSIKDKTGKVALHYAAYSDFLGGVKLLLEKCDNIAVKDNTGRTALHYAAEGIAGDVLKLLIDEGTNTSVEDQSGRTALHYAAMSGTADSVKALLLTGVDPNKQDEQGKTALHYAAMYGTADSVKALLLKGVDPNAQDEAGQVALHHAARRYSSGSIHLLLDKDVNLTVKDNTGRTALHCAAQEGLFDSVRLLLEKGFDPNERDNQGKVALHYAAQSSDNVDILKLFIDKGPNPSVEDNSGRTAVHYAAMKGLAAHVLHLLLKGIDPNKQDDQGKTALHYAAGLGSHFMRRATVDILLHHGSEVNIRDRRGMTALHHAAEAGKHDFTALLIDNGATIDQQLMTHLHYAAERDNIQCFRLLVQQGIDTSIQDNEGRTAFLCAGNELKEILIKIGYQI